MTAPIKTGFELDGVVLRIDSLLPSKALPPGFTHTTKYKTILASVREVGVIEPFVVYRQSDGRYLLLDGHLRVEALKELGKEEEFCLVATDEETYTYNHKVNRVAPIQAIRMILKALEAGVSEEKVARALNLSEKTIHMSRSVLSGICPETIELLKDKPISQLSLREFKRVKPSRQIVMARLMVGAGNYTSSYAQALVKATSESERVASRQEAKKDFEMKPEDLARMRHEMCAVEKDFLALEETYSRNVYDLTLVRSYLGKLLENARRIVRFLAQQQREVLAEFQRIAEASTI
jgi:ParB-like chromosome segregation protein Spo0J